MSGEMRNDIRATVSLLKGLDKESLLLIQAGAQMLKARNEMNQAAGPNEPNGEGDK